MHNCFLDIDYARINKKSQRAGGDVFLSRKSDTDGRVVSVLSDGLGSGIKANVLATLTTTLAAGCIAGSLSIERTAEVIMRSLPECSERKISYATFTIIDIEYDGSTRIIEYDNPGYLLLRDGKLLTPEKKMITVNSPNGRNSLYFSFIKLQSGDRIVMYSDGVPQSGIGNRELPLGWETERANDWIVKKIAGQPDISSRELSKAVVNRAVRNDIYIPRDDITCAVIFARQPRKLMVVTGPPLDSARDSELAGMVKSFPGKMIVSGGTTANIISRELGRKVRTDLSRLDEDLPPTAQMDGIDLVTEGIFTLARTAELLESGEYRSMRRQNGASQIIDLLLDSDEINFVVGTRINNAHQDPNVPVGLEIRRNIVNRIGKCLSDKLLKEVNISYI